MSKKYEMTDEEYKRWNDVAAKNAANWRSWGSWFSWGSPVGLGLFFIEIAAATWIFFHVAK